MASLATLAALFFAVRRLTGSILLSDLDSDLQNQAHNIASNLSAVSLADASELEHLVREPREISLGPGRVMIVIDDSQGNELAASPSARDQPLTLSEADLSTLADGGSLTRSLKSATQHTIRLYAETAPASDGDAIVVAAASTSAVDAAVDRVETILIGVVSAGAVVSIGVGYVVAREGLARLQKVVDIAVKTEAFSLLDRRIAARNEPAEVQKLADAFDAMLERLQHAFAQQRDFVANVSHELRTPLTALQGNLDVLLMDPSLDPEVRDHLERLSGETARLIRLVANLLSLASAEAGRRLDMRPVELDVVILEVYREQGTRRADVRLRLGHEDQARVSGDREMLKQLVTNLVENALKYSPSGAEVRLSLYRDRTLARLEVTDSGPGIAPEDLPHIFERFYRGKNAARAGGTGLGLAIAHWVATAHGGRIDVESALGKGTTFRVWLPLAEAAGPRDSTRL
ncbi:MAG TPA: ATP-binding protein [Dehalococcoidia bacterium]|nr:ATP-binding protein [Dehalococcoidia bacterium]